MTLSALRTLGLSLLCVGGLVTVWPAAAQSAIYRCGNEYTNNPVNAEARGCKLMEGGNLTVVEGLRPRGGASAAKAPAKGEGSSAKPGARSDNERVDQAEQRARDADARTILDNELRRAEQRLADLREEYRDGQPDMLASERSSPERYQARVADLKARLERAQSDVAGIKRELARFATAR